MDQHNARIEEKRVGTYFKDGMPTGDGLFSALKILSVPANLRTFGLNAGQQRKTASFLPALSPVENLSLLKAAQSSGHRTVVRYSGTEPKLTILVEGHGSKQWTERIKDEFLTLVKTG